MPFSKARPFSAAAVAGVLSSRSSCFHNLATAMQHVRQQAIAIATMEEDIGASARLPHIHARAQWLARGVHTSA